MPSKPPDSGWDFSSVIDLIDSDVHDICSPTLRPAPKSRSSIPTGEQEGGVGLGNFSKLYQGLGFDTQAPVSTLPPLDRESDLSNSDEALLPSPVLEVSTFTSQKENDAATELSKHTGLNKKQRRKARRQELEQIEQERKESEQVPLSMKSTDDALNVSIKINNDATVEAFPKLPKDHSRSNVSAKMRPVSPGPDPSIEKPLNSSRSPKKVPKTPKILRRTSTSPSKKSVLPVTPLQLPLPTELKRDQQHDIPLGTPVSFLIPLAPQHFTQLPPTQSQPSAARQAPFLVPRTVQPVTVPRSSQPIIAVPPPSTPTPIATQPPIFATPVSQGNAVTIRSQVDRHLSLFSKLLNYFPDDRKWLVAPMQLITEKTTETGLHVFVDTSNIMYGFRDTLRTRGIHQQYDMSFDSLALFLQRRRPVCKRIFAGSHREANPLPHMAKLTEMSKAVGYESHVVEQVFIVREDSEKKKFFNDVKKVGWYKAQQMRSGSGSDSETGPVSAPKAPANAKWVEQGVDELLHLKMCQSIIDTDVPSTMVLATGDGAEAEMSDGFLAHVERALKKGWKVELVSWKQQINGGYRNRQFRSKWADSFSIIELDDFLEDIIDTP